MTLDAVLALAAQPTVGVPADMARQCYDHYAATHWRDKNGNRVGGSARAMESLLRKWKARQPSFGKTIAPDAGSPRTQTRDEARAQAVRDCADMLEPYYSERPSATDRAAFADRVRIAAEKWRRRDYELDADGRTVVEAAIEELKQRRKRRRGGE
jgi:hypothetical protein